MVKVTEPKIENRNEQHYAGIQTLASIHELGTVIPQLHSEVFKWLAAQGMKPAGAPFIRFNVINMADNLDIELGWFTESPVSGNGRVQARVLPAGQYASLIYTGIENGMEGNRVLIEWAQEKSIEWDRWDAENGDAFRARYETFLTDPADEPNMAKWETEVAIKLKD